MRNDARGWERCTRRDEKEGIAGKEKGMKEITPLVVVISNSYDDIEVVVNQTFMMILESEETLPHGKYGRGR